MNDHYSPEFINAQQEALLKAKARLEQELKEVAVFDKSQGKYMPKYEEFNPGDVEDVEEAADETVHFVENTATADTLVQTLDETLNSLKDIANGKYGYCENCSGHISEERLRAYPAAKTCVKCEQS